MTAILPLARHERFEAGDDRDRLRARLRPLFTLPAADAVRFPVALDAVAVGGALFLRLAAEGLRLVREPTAERRGGWDHPAILIVRRGSLAVALDRGTRTLLPNDHVRLDMSRGFDLSATSPFEASIVLWRRELAGASAHGAIGRAGEGPSDLVAYHADHLLGEAGGLAPREAQAAVRALVHLATAGPGAAGEPSTDAGRERLLSLRRFLASHSARRDLNPERLAEALGVSRAVLYRTAAPEGGVAAMLQDARLRHAAALLLSEEAAARRIGEIAEIVGYPSGAGFSRRFTDRFGLAPLAFRALHRASGERDVDPRFTLWLSD